MSHFVQFDAFSEHYLQIVSQLAHKPALTTNGGGHADVQVLL